MDTFQQALAEQVAEQHRHHGKALFFYVWGALLVMTAIEVYLTYQHMQPVKTLIIGYFMHLKYEVSRMKWLTMCSVVACLILMTIFFFPDARRILELGVK